MITNEEIIKILKDYTVVRATISNYDVTGDNIVLILIDSSHTYYIQAFISYYKNGLPRRGITIYKKEDKDDKTGNMIFSIDDIYEDIRVEFDYLVNSRSKEWVKNNINSMLYPQKPDPLECLTKYEIRELKENNDIKFIYKIPCSFYDEGYEYIIIGSNLNIEQQNIRVFSLDDWFLLMKSGSLLPYVCSILSKSGKIKEYINIYEKPDIVKLRKYIIDKASYLENINKGLSDIDMELIRECLWGIQVIKESKVNRIDVFKEKIIDPLKEFMIASDSIYKMSLTNV